MIYRLFKVLHIFYHYLVQGPNLLKWMVEERKENIRKVNIAEFEYIIYQIVKKQKNKKNFIIKLAN